MSTTWYKWRVQASNDLQWYTVLTTTNVEPTVIDFDGTHGVVAGSGLITAKNSSVYPTVQSEDSRLMIAPIMFPDYMNPYITSAGDDMVNGIRGADVMLSFLFNGSNNGTSTIVSQNIRFVDYVQLSGGKINISGGNKDDYINFFAFAPPTPVTFNGSDLGNCNLYDLSGGANLYHLIIPAPGNGTNNVDITSPLNANLTPANGIILVTQAVPVPAMDANYQPNGYWDWDQQSGAITPNYNGVGQFNLYDFELPLLNYINRLCVCNGHPTMPHQITTMIGHRSGPFLPHWISTLQMTYAASHKAGDVVFYSIEIFAARTSPL